MLIWHTDLNNIISLQHTNKIDFCINFTTMTQSQIDYRAHSFGCDMNKPCEERVVVKMVVEMLLGLSNDIFTQLNKPLENLFQHNDDGDSKQVVDVRVFLLTVYASQLHVGTLSSSMVKGILQWFAHLGSFMYVCRKFSERCQANFINNQGQSITASVIDSMRSSISDLLTSVDEALCSIESAILEIPRDKGLSSDGHLNYHPQVTLIRLYQRFMPWEPLFRSLAGMVASMLPGSALLLHDSFTTTATATGDSLYKENTMYAESAIYTNLATRGVMEGLCDLVTLGAMVEVQGSVREQCAQNGNIKTDLDAHSEKGLSLSLPKPCVCESHQFAALLLAAMTEKRLASLSGTLWQQQQRTPLQATDDNTTVSLGARCSGGSSSTSQRIRRKQQRYAEFCHSAAILIRKDSSYAVPTFLWRVTQEAQLSSSDFALLQKSHVQRQNHCYDQSRLQALVEASIRLFRCTLLPDAVNYSISAPSQSLDGTDPLSLYLRTGQSIKVVGVRTQKSSSELCGGQSATVPGAATTSKLLSIVDQPTPVPASATLDSYRSGKDYMSNTYYLGHLLPIASRSASAALVSPTKSGPSTSTAPPTDSDINVVYSSDRLAYSPMRAKLQLTLLSSVRERLWHARADSATFVRSQFALLTNLRYLRDVYLLGQPDYFASIRAYCLGLSVANNTSSAAKYRTGYSALETVDFMCEAVTNAVNESAPQGGVRYASVQSGDAAGQQRTTQHSGGAPSGGVRKTSAKHSGLPAFRTLTGSLRAAVSSLYPATAVVETFPLPAPVTANRELNLLQMLSTLTLTTTHYWPLTQFFHTGLLAVLNNQLRFLLLLASSRWAAEYYWMDVISNDSLGTAAHQYGTKARALAATKTAFPEYLQDILQAKRNCRTGLALWLHTITAVINIFMGHIHRTLWPAFERELERCHESLLRMQSVFAHAVRDIEESLLLLRERILEVLVVGFAATCAMRDAVEVESSDKSEFSATATSTKTSSSGTTSVPKQKGLPSSIPSIPSKAVYQPSASVLIAFRQAEDAFAVLKQAVLDLKMAVSRTIKDRAALGLNERQDLALSELQIALA